MRPPDRAVVGATPLQFRGIRGPCPYGRYLAAAGGGGGVTPDSIAGLWRWYRASYFDGVGADGNSIGGGANNLGAWLDETLSGDDATAGTGPVYKTGIFGAASVIRFTTEFMSWVPGGLGDFTFIAVLQQTGTSSFLAINAGTGTQLRLSFLADNSRLVYEGVANGAGAAADAFSAPTDPQMLVFRRTGSDISFFENTTARGVVTYTSNSFLVNEIGYSASGGRIDLGELLLYNVSVSDADIASLYTDYFQPKFSNLP